MLSTFVKRASGAQERKRGLRSLRSKASKGGRPSAIRTLKITVWF